MEKSYFSMVNDLFFVWIEPSCIAAQQSVAIKCFFQITIFIVRSGLKVVFLERTAKVNFAQALAHLIGKSTVSVLHSMNLSPIVIANLTAW